jgi:hypothetical protein
MKYARSIQPGVKAPPFCHSIGDIVQDDQEKALPFEMVDNSSSLRKSPFGRFFVSGAVPTGHLTLE